MTSGKSETQDCDPASATPTRGRHPRATNHNSSIQRGRCHSPSRSLSSGRCLYGKRPSTVTLVSSLSTGRLLCVGGRFPQRGRPPYSLGSFFWSPSLFPRVPIYFFAVVVAVLPFLHRVYFFGTSRMKLGRSLTF
jgi:hypothetical protein